MASGEPRAYRCTTQPGHHGSADPMGLFHGYLGQSLQLVKQEFGHHRLPGDLARTFYFLAFLTL